MYTYITLENIIKVVEESKQIINRAEQVSIGLDKVLAAYRTKADHVNDQLGEFVGQVKACPDYFLYTSHSPEEVLDSLQDFARTVRSSDSEPCTYHDDYPSISIPLQEGAKRKVCQTLCKLEQTLYEVTSTIADLPDEAWACAYSSVVGTIDRKSSTLNRIHLERKQWLARYTNSRRSNDLMTAKLKQLQDEIRQNGYSELADVLDSTYETSSELHAAVVRLWYYNYRGAEGCDLGRYLYLFRRYEAFDELAVSFRGVEKTKSEWSELLISAASRDPELLSKGYTVTDLREILSLFAQIDSCRKLLFNTRGSKIAGVSQVGLCNVVGYLRLKGVFAPSAKKIAQILFDGESNNTLADYIGKMAKIKDSEVVDELDSAMDRFRASRQ